MILISGITGFVGINLKKYLHKERQIIGVSREENKSEQIISYNQLYKNNYMNEAYAFIHLAGKAHDIKGVSEEKEYYDVNTNLTVDVFNEFLKSDCKIFIFLSSVKAIRDTIEYELTEKDIPSPKTVYGKSKLLAEEYIKSKKIPENKSVYILRPCMIHGPNNKGNLNLLFNLMNRGIPYPLGSFQNKRSFLSIDNLCFIIDNLLKKKPKSNSFCLADNDSISTSELVELLGEINGKKVKILNVNKNLIRTLAKIGNFLPIIINEEKLKKLTENYQVSNKKIKEELQVDMPISLKEGLIKTVQSFKN